VYGTPAGGEVTSRRSAGSCSRGWIPVPRRTGPSISVARARSAPACRRSARQRCRSSPRRHRSPAGSGRPSSDGDHIRGGRRARAREPRVRDRRHPLRPCPSSSAHRLDVRPPRRSARSQRDRGPTQLVRSRASSRYSAAPLPETRYWWPARVIAAAGRRRAAPAGVGRTVPSARVPRLAEPAAAVPPVQVQTGRCPAWPRTRRRRAFARPAVRPQCLGSRSGRAAPCQRPSYQALVDVAFFALSQNTLLAAPRARDSPAGPAAEGRAPSADRAGPVARRPSYHDSKIRPAGGRRQKHVLMPAGGGPPRPRGGRARLAGVAPSFGRRQVPLDPRQAAVVPGLVDVTAAPRARTRTAPRSGSRPLPVPKPAGQSASRGWAGPCHRSSYHASWS